MGLAPEVMLVVKHTFLEFVESGSVKSRSRAFTDTVLLNRFDDDCNCSELSTVDSLADTSGTLCAAECEGESSPPWPATPALEAQEPPAELWQGKDGVDVEATTEVKAVLGMTAEDLASQSQQFAWWWWPSDLAMSVDSGEDRADFHGYPLPAHELNSSTAVETSSAPPASFATGAGHFNASADVEGYRTTLMIRSLPASCSRGDLLEALDSSGFAGQYDFVYVPVDFGSGKSLGYAFVNLISPAAADRAWTTFDGFEQWPETPESACTVCWSHPHQGLASHVERYMNSPVMHHTVPDAWKPALFANGVRVAFPPPTKIIKAPKAPRSRKAEAA